MNIDQSQRNERGRKHKFTIENLLENLKKRRYIKDYFVNVREAYPNKNGQFYFPVVIQFFNGEEWLIQSTTSYPRERINGYQWNAMHLKKINDCYKKAYIVYPDTMNKSEIKSCMAYRENIVNDRIYSEIDDIVSFADLYLLIEEKWLEADDSPRKKALQGTAFEKLLVDILVDNYNKEIWNDLTGEGIGFNYPYFKKILLGFGIDPAQKISHIEATDRIPLIERNTYKKSAGKPKTDIHVVIYFENKSSVEYTISSKRTSGNWVAIHQYSVEDYIKVLNIEEEDLKLALYELQSTGAHTKMGETNKNIILEKFPKYYRALAEWAYAGIGGGGSGIQIVEYFTIYKNNTKELEIYPREEYIEKILREVTNGQFNSPFQFTYTGKRGTNIQIKGRVL